MTHQRVRTVTTLLTLTLATVVAPDAAAQTRPAVAPSGKGHTAADVQFMRGMIAHHAQAIVMAAMAPTHGASAHVGLFARKVMVSQRDEIELMQGWLEDHAAAMPDSGESMAHHAMHKDMSATEHATLMPGMLTTAQLAQLEQARDTTFDRLFLTFMIQHHEGALAMVATLFDSPGAGQTPEIFGFATGVDADQRAEIARMQGMLTTITGRTAK